MTKPVRLDFAKASQACLAVMEIGSRKTALLALTGHDVQTAFQTEVINNVCWLCVTAQISFQLHLTCIEDQNTYAIVQCLCRHHNKRVRYQLSVDLGIKGRYLPAITSHTHNVGGQRSGHYFYSLRAESRLNIASSSPFALYSSSETKEELYQQVSFPSLWVRCIIFLFMKQCL